MPARRSELWRRLEAVQREVVALRAQRERAKQLASTWRALPDEARAQHWDRQAQALGADLRELLAARTELALAIAVREPTALTTKGTRAASVRGIRG